ncbi:DUF4129 domain-containing protein [Natranaeroarchaeum aerophilus]|uniref:DUF4129 domain-containing protein n=1 Tax=Natranaeroarchaeum aerophilus TaxID=2917711 RepID=A0AAE3FR02_9EURY|nr:DUF4129 domain-containing protein [Natranaeroarchaeum aerophilus]MCL9813495.1 DUF4129 domain-containing protein [Natranaeroarchaeum aerophilus]
MNESTRSAIIAGMAIFAVAYAAATLDSTVRPEGGGGDGTVGTGDGGSGVVPVTQSESPPGETITIPYLDEILAILAVVLLLGLIAYVVLYRRQALAMFLVLAVSLVAMYLLSAVLDPTAVPPDIAGLEPGDETPVGDGSGEGWGDGSGVDPTQPSPPALLVVVVVGLTIIGGALALLSTRTEDSDESVHQSTGDGENAAAIGRAAGRAADRLEAEENVDNEVYRAWREMADLTDVDNPGSTTPGEFAAAAAETGLGRDDVTELTRLFEDVRYGNTQPSEERERQAITIFRRIENRYAEEEP